MENLRARAVRSPDPELDALTAELSGYVPPHTPDDNYLGFAVPLRLRCAEGELRLLTTLTSFATAVDVTPPSSRLRSSRGDPQPSCTWRRSCRRTRTVRASSERAQM
nr:hypothetical protein [Streptomyces brasiliensis]